MNELDIEVQATFGAMLAKIDALKSALSENQLEVYNKSLAESKDKLIKHYSPLSDELLAKIDRQFQ